MVARRRLAVIYIYIYTYIYICIHTHTHALHKRGADVVARRGPALQDPEAHTGAVPGASDERAAGDGRRLSVLLYDGR